MLVVICPNMSADEDDDYLSDKFLVTAASTTTKASSYSEIRKEAHRKAQLKNVLNRQKGRHQREIEAREEGLSKSLFERAKEEAASGSGSTNKALSIMMKMGFKPGQSLGNTGDHDGSHESSGSPTTTGIDTDTAILSTASDERKRSISSASPGDGDASSVKAPDTRTQHKTEPLPLNEWEGASDLFFYSCISCMSTIIDDGVLSIGRKGIGLGKRRARSPSAAERLAKMAKMAENMEQRDYRERTRDEYNNRRAEGRLGRYSHSR